LPPLTPFHCSAKKEDAGQRLDLFLLQQLPQFSRSRIQSWIKDDRTRVNGQAAKASYILQGTESIEVEPVELAPLNAFAEEIPLDILYSDDDVIAVNKPAGLVVHSGAGNHSGTLVNALLHHFSTLSTVGGDDRPGIVHRIDRETSGVLLIARTDQAHRHLAEQFAARTVEKTYLTLVQGRIEQLNGRVETKIARDPVRRTRMTTRLNDGRTALTFYRVLERFARYTFLEVKIGTGRTHQIRVHLASIGHPVAGDKLYGAAVDSYNRFFLHAHRISFDSPSRGERVTVEAALPPELSEWLAAIKNL
jgi:23S rRNA pseudouridine1911/1915/1917 synthase